MAFVGDAGVIGFSGPFDGVWRERVYGISRTALGGLGYGVNSFGDTGRNRSVEGAIEVVDFTTPGARAFVRFGGPLPDGRGSETVAARKRSRLGNGRGSEPVCSPSRLSTLDQPPGSLDPQTVLRDTPAALDQLPESRARFRRDLPQRAIPRVAQLEISVRSALDPPKPITWLPVIDPQKLFSTLSFKTGVVAVLRE